MARPWAKTVQRAVFLVCITAVMCAYIGRGLFYRAVTIGELLNENKNLKRAISNLTREEQIGYAKVVEQKYQDGKLFTTIKFVETARDDKGRTILEKQYTIEGDIVHFDALIVRFGQQLVADGKARALYLWRRVYGEKMAPEDGFIIEQPGAEPRRYSDLFAILPAAHRRAFWEQIWDLANDPEKLKAHGIVAAYGNAVYSRLRPGFIYVFKISPSGQVTPEVVPDI